MQQTIKQTAKNVLLNHSKANYNLVSRDGDLLYLSGHLPARDGASDLVTGRLTPGGGQDRSGLTIDQGYEAAKWCGLNLVASMKEALNGDLDRVDRVRWALWYDNSNLCHDIVNAAFVFCCS